MSKTKKILAIIMVLICCFAFCSCQYGSTKNDKNEKTTTETTDTPQNLNGHWELSNKRAEKNNDIGSPFSKSKSIFTVSQTLHTFEYTYDDEPDVMNGEHFSGKYSISISEPAKTYSVGDKITVTLKAKAISYTDKKRTQSFTGRAELQSEEVAYSRFSSDDYDVCAGTNTYIVPYAFNDEDDETYQYVFEKKDAGKLKTFWIVVRTQAGESVWEYDWVEDK